MTLFRSDTHRTAWISRWCDSCFQPDQAQLRIQGTGNGCPILARALKSGRKPPQWDRTRSTDMETSIKCNEYSAKPAVVRRGTAFEDVPMFDVEPQDTLYVPVDGWPDPPRKKGLDHA